MISSHSASTNIEPNNEQKDDSNQIAVIKQFLQTNIAKLPGDIDLTTVCDETKEMGGLSGDEIYTIKNTSGKTVKIIKRFKGDNRFLNLTSEMLGMKTIHNLNLKHCDSIQNYFTTESEALLAMDVVEEITLKGYMDLYKLHPNDLVHRDNLHAAIHLYAKALAELNSTELQPIQQLNEDEVKSFTNKMHEIHDSLVRHKNHYPTLDINLMTAHIDNVIKLFLQNPGYYGFTHGDTNLSNFFINFATQKVTMIDTAYCASKWLTKSGTAKGFPANEFLEAASCFPLIGRRLELSESLNAELEAIFKEAYLLHISPLAMSTEAKNFFKLFWMLRSINTPLRELENYTGRKEYQVKEGLLEQMIEGLKTEIGQSDLRNNIYWHPEVSERKLEIIESKSAANIKVYVDSENIESIKAAFIKLNITQTNFTPVTSSQKTSSTNLDIIKSTAINKMDKCAKVIDDNVVTYTIASADGITEKDGEHYYVGIIAATIHINRSKFTFLSSTTPQKISPDEKMVTNKEELYRIAMSKALRRLANVHLYTFKPLENKVDSVITFGTFDMLHDLHKRLIRNAFNIGKNVVIYVNNKNQKRKGNGYISLNEHADERIAHMKEFAFSLCTPDRQVIVRPMTRKHIPELKRAIREFSANGKTVAVWGGEDQFSVYYDMLELCYLLKTPIYTINRGDEGNKLCSSDIRLQKNYQRSADAYGVDMKDTSVTLFKTPLSTLPTYTRNLALFGNDRTAELWKYNNDFFLDTRILGPIKCEGRILICVPGRTECDRDRARKIFKTMMNRLSNPNEKINYFLLGYKVDGKDTSYYVNKLENDPYGYFSDDAMLIVKNLFMPLVSEDIRIYQNNGIWTLQTSPMFVKKSIQELEQIFSKITLSGRSRGSVIALEIENAFLFCMRSLGFTNEEIARVGKQVCVVNVSNLASLQRDRIFSTFSATGVNDTQALKYIKALPEISQCNNPAASCTIKAFSNTHLAVFARIPSSIQTGKDAKGNPDPKCVLSDEKCHYTPLFISHRENGDNTLPDLINGVFGRVVERSGGFDIKQFCLK